MVRFPELSWKTICQVAEVNKGEDMKKYLAIIVVLAFSMQGCAIGGVVGAAYHSKKRANARKEFISNYHKTNMEREANGLEPLDWCTEAYRNADKMFAKKDENCRRRIAAYEAGDTSALGESMLQSEIDALPEAPKKEPGNKYAR
jgi:hypothetical protein